LFIAIELALDKSLWRLLVASGATHWYGACRIMMMMITHFQKPDGWLKHLQHKLQICTSLRTQAVLCFTNVDVGTKISCCSTVTE